MKALARLLWAALAVVLFCIALLAVNQSQVALRFLGWQTPEVSVFWWLLLAFIVGLCVSAVACSLATLRLRMRQRSVAKQLNAAHREIEKLRAVNHED